MSRRDSREQAALAGEAARQRSSIVPNKSTSKLDDVLGEKDSEVR